MSTANRGSRRLVVFTGLLLAVAVACASCGATGPAAPAPKATGPLSPKATGPLSPPKTSAVMDSQYLMDVTEADPALVTYVQQRGNTAMRTLLTDGSAFCAFLHRGGGIDNAMVSVALGANSVESQTKLPRSITTYNTIESVALLTLCPSDQELVPASDRTKIRELGEELAKHAS
jgi:hypothetical protein